MPRKVLLLPGDGIGPEVITQAKRMLEAVAGVARELTWEEAAFGGVAIDDCGDPLPERTLELATEADAVLLGAVGGPKYDSLPVEQRPEKGLLRLRSSLDVFANFRPIICFEGLSEASTLKREVVENLDILIVRELTGGIYFSEPRGIEGSGDDRAGYNTMRYSASEIRRVAKVAFEAASRRGGRICSVDKANVLEVSILWRETVSEVAKDYPEVELSHLYVDNCAMQLVRNPRQFDVIVTSNLFGDVLSDLASELAGSIGMLPSAALGEDNGLYEPVHGSAPDIAGDDVANPCAAVLSLAMLLEHSLGETEAATVLRDAVKDTIKSGLRTADIAQEGSSAIGCSQMGDAILSSLNRSLE